MLINLSTENIIRVLLNERESKLRLRELSEKAKVSLGMAVKIVGALESSGQLTKKRGISVNNWEKLLKTWAYLTSLTERKKAEFLGAERPQYLIKKIASLLANEQYALTLFSATELVAPYVAPNKVHLYLPEKILGKTKDIFEQGGIMQAEEGNIVVYIVPEHFFYGSFEILGAKIISLPQLYADLFAYGGRGEEAAEHILRLMREKHV